VTPSRALAGRLAPEVPGGTSIPSMPLFAGKPEVTLQTDAESILAGGTIRARATFGAPDRKTQGGRIELVYRNTYKHDTTDSDGDRTTSTTHSDVVVGVHQIQIPESGLTEAVEASFVVPPDAPGTAGESIEWEVRAIVDRKLGRDARAEAPLTVLVPAEQLAAWAGAAPQPSVSWPLTIAPSARVVRAGDRITGTLTFTPAETIKADGVRVQLRRHRSDPDNNSDSNDKTRVELLGKTELRAGESQTLSFSIDVPAGAPPSFVAHFNHQHWFLEGVIDVSLSKDPRVSAEIVVHTA